MFSSVSQLLKFPPVIDIASEVTREKQWDSVVTVHDDMRLVQTWAADKGSLGQHKLIHERYLHLTYKRFYEDVLQLPRYLGHF